MVIERLLTRYKLRWEAGPAYAQVARVPEGPWGEGFLLARPLLYMNESGKALASLCMEYSILPWHLIVVHDDMDIPFGTLRIKRDGGSGGHRGVESIIACLGTDRFVRVKVGIGRPPEGTDPRDYVLLPFDEDLREVELLIERAADACIDVLTLGPDRAMNLYNRTTSASGRSGTDPSGDLTEGLRRL